MSIAWDEWGTVEAALRESAHSDASFCLVCVAFANAWSPVAKFHATTFASLRQRGLAPFAKIFLIDFDTNVKRCIDMGVLSPPAVCLYWAGEPMTIRRVDWDDDEKVVGSTSEDKWLQILHAARDAGDRGHRMVHVDL